MTAAARQIEQPDFHRELAWPIATHRRVRWMHITPTDDASALDAVATALSADGRLDVLSVVAPVDLVVSVEFQTRINQLITQRVLAPNRLCLAVPQDAARGAGRVFVEAAARMRRLGVRMALLDAHLDQIDLELVTNGCLDFVFYATDVCRRLLIDAGLRQVARSVNRFWSQHGVQAIAQGVGNEACNALDVCGFELAIA